MKRRTKAIVFFASMALTVGSLTAIVGSRHHMCGMHQNTCMKDRAVANSVIHESPDSIGSGNK